LWGGETGLGGGAPTKKKTWGGGAGEKGGGVGGGPKGNRDGYGVFLPPPLPRGVGGGGFSLGGSRCPRVLFFFNRGGEKTLVKGRGTGGHFSPRVWARGGTGGGGVFVFFFVP